MTVATLCWAVAAGAGPGHRGRQRFGGRTVFHALRFFAPGFVPMPALE
ncbi:hypothetical protein AB5J55_41015 [Streptomyces sp. R11]|uniref:Uncharacterized protein n=1 Tax=Streptomyces sp. R11 TaxID=3238625 RepID=A0AB39NCC0_9ACTN